MNPLLTLTVLAGAIGSGVIAGVFFAFSTFVMKALAEVSPVAGIQSMQAINRTVINPWFLTPFLGTAVIGLLAAVYGLWQWQQPMSGWLVAGGVLYVLGTFLVTVAANVPMNEKLAAADATSDDAAVYWPHYLSRWSLWNHVRTAAAGLATIAFILALRSPPV